MKLTPLKEIYAFAFLLVLAINQTVAFLVFTLSNQSPENLWHLACFQTSLTIVLSGIILAWQRLDIFDGPLLIYLAFAVFHGGQILLVATIGLPDSQPFLDGFFSLQKQTTLVILVGFSCLALVSGIIPANPRCHTKTWDPEILARYENSLIIIGLGLFSVTVIPFIIEAQTYLRNLYQGGRFQVFGTGEDVAWEASGKILFHAFPISGLLFIAGSQKHKTWLIIGLSLLFLNFSFHLYLGNRGYAVMPVLSAFWLIDKVHYRFSRLWLTIIGGLTVSLFFPIIRFIRSNKGPQNIQDTLIEFGFLDLFRYSLFELGNTLRVVGWTTGLIEKHGLQLGETYLRALSTAIPNLFWEVHWGVQSIVLREEIKVYVRQDILGYYKQQGWGGSTLAEAWLNFGVVGAVVTIGFIGYLFSYLHRWSINGGNPARLFVFAVILSSVFMAIRGDIYQVVRPFFWHGLIPFLTVLLLSHVKPLKDMRLFKTN